MAPVADNEVVFEDTDVWNGIASFAVLDLETSNLPAYNFNKAAITEISIYGFAAKELQQLEENDELKTDAEGVMPPTPRILHKLTLLLNPRMMVHPQAEEITGLNNYMLEHESYFDENAANTILGFLKHLQQPVCLVAHNGWNFDFPILKQAFDKLKLFLPSETLCVDSFRAFHEIDEFRKTTIANPSAPVMPACASETVDEETSFTDALCENDHINWRARNETTPKRPPVGAASASRARKRLADVVFCSEVTPERKQVCPSPPQTFKSRRTLFPSYRAAGKWRTIRKFPPKGVYKLDKMYERIFRQPPAQSHHAEADVEALMKLMLHYGTDFLAYATDKAIPFAEVRPVGASGMFW